MKTINSANRAIIFLLTISIVNSFLDTSLILLVPILTVIIPYKLMKHENVNENNLLTRILIFNIVNFILVSIILNKTSIYIFETIVNLIISLVYFLIILRFQNRYLEKNPEKLYEKINIKIEALEIIKNKIEEDIDSIDDEKKKNSMKSQLNAIENKLNDLKNESEKIKSLIEINNKKVD